MQGFGEQHVKPTGMTTDTQENIYGSAPYMPNNVLPGSCDAARLESMNTNTHNLRLFENRPLTALT